MVSRDSCQHGTLWELLHGILWDSMAWLGMVWMVDTDKLRLPYPPATSTNDNAARSSLSRYQKNHKKLRKTALLQVTVDRAKISHRLGSPSNATQRIFSLRGQGRYPEKKIAVLLDFVQTRSYAALWAADLGWIVGPGYSSGGKVIIFRYLRGVTTDLHETE